MFSDCMQIGERSESSKPAVWIDAGIHAREWIAPATAVYIIHQVDPTVHCKKFPYIHRYSVTSVPYFNGTGSVYDCIRKSMG